MIKIIPTEIAPKGSINIIVPITANESEISTKNINTALQ